MDWRAAFLTNWPFKLSALMLSLLLWFNVSAEEQRQDQPVRTRLEIDVADSGWVAVEVPDEVTAIFAGRSGDMFALFNQPVVRKVIESVEDSVMSLRLSPSDVAYDRSLSVRPIAVSPSEVELRFEPLVTRRVPVTIDLSATTVEGFVTYAPIVQPESVTVRGAQSEVNGISHLDTPVRLGSVQRASTRQVPVPLPAGLSTVTVEPAQVLVTVEVDAVIERRLAVRVEPQGPGAMGMRVTPATVMAVLRGGRTQVERLSASDVQAVVVVAGASQARRSLPVAIRLPAGLTVTASSDPPRVQVYAEEGAS